MRKIFATLVAVILVAISTVAADIKSTTKLSLSPLGTVAPIKAITDARVLTLSNVFAGSFIGEAVDAPNPSFRRYAISFDIQLREGIKTDAYVVEYCVDDATGEAFVYLPGRGEPSYRRNVSTILRDGKDGHWHRASTEWSALLQPYVR
jgi:hypothetical protein